MSVLDELKPTRKLLVMNLLRETGLDVSAWENFKGKSAAANPKYCYNWSFEQPGEFVAVCLWHRDLRKQKGTVVFARNYKARTTPPGVSGSTVWNRRAAEFGRNLETAYRQQLPVRVIVVDGAQRNISDTRPKASIVRARLLDPMAWAVKEYDAQSGDGLLVRGAKPGIPAVSSADLELSWFEGKRKKAFIFHRRREALARREKIREALSQNEGKLVCEVPSCGFDFAARYGSLGEGYAQVHHLKPLSQFPHEGSRIRLNDLAVVCANCHVMIHLGGKCRPIASLIPGSS